MRNKVLIVDDIELNREILTEILPFLKSIRMKLRLCCWIC